MRRRAWILQVTGQFRLVTGGFPPRCLAVFPVGWAPPPLPPSPPTVATVDISHPQVVISRTDPRYVSVTLDGSYNRGWFQRNLTDPMLVLLAKQLSPAILRFGGSGNDYFDYNVPAGQVQPTLAACRPNMSYPAAGRPATATCPPWSDSKHCAANAKVPGFCERAAAGPQPKCCRECKLKPWNSSHAGCNHRSHFSGGHATPATLTCTCLTQQRADGLLRFAAATNLSLVFGLTISADVNSTHTMALLKYLHDTDATQAIYGFEYGNEQEGTLPNRTQALQFKRLGRILATLYADKPRTPVLICPDTNSFSDALIFAKQARNVSARMHAITYVGTSYIVWTLDCLP